MKYSNKNDNIKLTCRKNIAVGFDPGGGSVMPKKKVFQVTALVLLLAGILAAGILLLTQDRNLGRSEHQADLSANTDEVLSGDIDPSKERYLFRLAEDTAEVRRENYQYEFVFFWVDGHLARLEPGEDVWLELRDCSSGEVLREYRQEYLSLQQEDSLLGLTVDYNGQLWVLLCNAESEYRVENGDMLQADKVTCYLSDYPMPFAPSAFFVWENVAVMQGNDESGVPLMAVYDLETGKPTVFQNVDSFCLDPEGGLYYNQIDSSGSTSLLRKRSLSENREDWQVNPKLEDGESIRQLFFQPGIGLFTMTQDTGQIDCRDSESGEKLYMLFSAAEDTDLADEVNFYQMVFGVDKAFHVWLSLLETDFNTTPFTHTRYTWEYEPYLSQTDPEDTVTLTITAPYPVDPIVSSIQMYTRQHPDVQFQWDTAYTSREAFWEHSSQYGEQLTLRLMAGDVGDILMVNGSGLDAGAILQTDVMADLSAYLDGCPFGNELIQSPLEALREEDGSIRALPVAIQPNYLIYNETLADQLGLNWDLDQLTWSKILDLAAEWQSENLDISLFLSSVSDDFLYSLLLANLDALELEDGTVDAGQEWFRNLIQQYRSVQGCSQWEKPVGDETFWWSPGVFSNALFMSYAGADYENFFNHLQLCEENNSISLRLIPIPLGEESEKRQSYAFCWGIPTVSEQKDTAWNFLEFVISDDGLVSDTYFAETCLLNQTADRQRFEEELIHVNGAITDEQNRHYEEFQSVLEYPVSRLMEPVGWYNAVYQPVSAYLADELSLDEAIRQINENWSSILQSKS